MRKYFFILSFIIFQIILPSNAQNPPCNITVCSVGCCDNSGNCVQDVSACQLIKNYDFTYLINTLITLASFIIGSLLFFILTFCETII